MSTIAVKKVKLGDNADLSKNFLIEVPAVADGTLTIKRENGTNVLSIDANGKAVIPGVVGTVAQVGGVPTGQVVERGSNADGEYVRFADGTQICTIRGLTVDTLALSYLLEKTWTFPASFVSVAGLSTNFSVRNNSDRFSGFTGWTADQVRQRMLTSFANTTLSASSVVVGVNFNQTVPAGAALLECAAIAIGRWF